MQNHPLPRLDQAPTVAAALQKYCRLQQGEIWEDPFGVHRVGCLDASQLDEVDKLVGGELAQLALHDPPSNLVGFDSCCVGAFVGFCRQLLESYRRLQATDDTVYVWIAVHPDRGL